MTTRLVAAGLLLATVVATLALVAGPFADAQPAPGANTLRLLLEDGTTRIPSALRPQAMEESLLLQPTRRSDGTSRVEALAGRETDMLVTSMPLTRDEVLEIIDTSGKPPVVHVLVCDAVAVVVNTSNDRDKLTFDELRGIFSGEFTNWTELGGLDEPIIPLMAGPDSDTERFFASKVMGDSTIAGSVTRLPGQRIIERIAIGDGGDNGAIGVVSWSHCNDRVKVLELRHSSREYGQLPTASAVRNGEYMLTRVIFGWTLGSPAAGSPARRFIDLVRSAAGQQRLTESNYFRLR